MSDQEMALQLHYYEIPKCPLRSYSQWELDEAEAHDVQIVPVDIMPVTHLKCTTHSISGRLSVRCDLLAYESTVKRVRVETKNVLEVEQPLLTLELTRAVFQTARDLGCDHVRVHIPDLLMCI